MPLEEIKCEAIILQMKSMSVDERLKAINESKAYLTNTFKPEMSNSDYAYSAYVLETSYNLIREELRVKQLRIKADAAVTNELVNANPKSQKAAAKLLRPKKEKPKPIDVKAMMAEFMNFQKSQSTTNGENS